MFSFFFGPNSKSRASAAASHPARHPASRDFPPSVSGPSSTSITVGRPSGEYDDVSLEGGGGDIGIPTGRPSFSAPPAVDGAFVGTSSSSAHQPASLESSYPPLPSFSRPSAATSSASSSRFPPLAETFARLEAVLDSQSPTLLDSLAPPLAPSDPALASLLAAIAPYRLPQPVLDSYLLHDGQDSLTYAAGGGAAGGGGIGGVGLVWGLWWMPLERVEEEWRFWRKLEAAGGQRGLADPFSASVDPSRRKRVAGGRAHPYVPEEGDGDAGEDGGAEVGMASFPDGWVRKRYTHPGWLPLLTDRCGNYIGVDLDPPPPTASSSEAGADASSSAAGRRQHPYGQPGQVIAFGREIDEKVVLFPGDGAGGWARFLAAFVEDVEKGEFARLGERPAAHGAGGAGWGGASDEESAGGEEGSGGSGDDGWEEGDGLGERGYFEAGVYGEDVVDSVRGSARDAQTWVLRAQYRRLAAQSSIDEGGLIALLAERSRRKWRSLGVGSAQPQFKPTSAMLRAGAGPLSVVVPRSSSTGVDTHEGEEEPKSAVTERAPPLTVTLPDGLSHPLAPPADAAAADASASPVELVLSPPSPTRAPPPLPPVTASSSPHTSPYASPRTSQDSSRTEGFLRDPPRSFRSRSASNTSNSNKRQSRRPPPPPPAPLMLPTFSELDFSETGPAPPTPQLPLPQPGWATLEDPVSSTTSALGRLSYGSPHSGGGAFTPTRESLLPTSRTPSSPRSPSAREVVRPEPVRATSIAMSDLAERSTTALVPATEPDLDPLAGQLSPPLSASSSDGSALNANGLGPVEVIVLSGEEPKRVRSPLDSPYEEAPEETTK
ncbi:hypothetical protein JCM5296_006353 [Sporobolomyces johnsonii]